MRSQLSSNSRQALATVVALVGLVIGPGCSSDPAGGPGPVIPDGAIAPPPPDAGVPDGAAPDAAPMGPRWKAVSAGGEHTCAIDSADQLWCWGSNSNGQLGDGNGGEAFSRPTPALVKGLGKVSSVAADWVHTCAATVDGMAFCWGENDGMQIGDPQAEQTKPFCIQGGCKEPVQVVELFNVRSVGTGARHSCAVVAVGTASCWGFNELGQLGDGQMPNDSARPSKVAGLTGVTQVSGSAWHSCAATATGKAYCWGDNADGNLGVDTPTEAGTPIEVPGLSDVEAVTAGDIHSCVRTTAGKVLCFGDNSAGQLGTSATTSSSTPQEVSGVSGARWVSAGVNHTCAVDGQGAVWCWGANGYDGNGDGTPETPNGKIGLPDGTPNSSAPVKIALAEAAVAVAAGDEHCCALTAAGQLFCWGLNDQGQLGSAGGGHTATPVQVPPPSP